MSTNSKATGLEARYIAEKIDDPEGKHRECAYFVLDPQHDPIARDALLAYSIRARREGYVQLADDLDTWLDDVTPTGETAR